MTTFLEKNLIKKKVFIASSRKFSSEEIEEFSARALVSKVLNEEKLVEL